MFFFVVNASCCRELLILSFWIWFLIIWFCWKRLVIPLEFWFPIVWFCGDEGFIFGFWFLIILWLLQSISIIVCKDNNDKGQEKQGGGEQETCGSHFYVNMHAQRERRMGAVKGLQMHGLL
jgi:hypothetical protein